MATPHFSRAGHSSLRRGRVSRCGQLYLVTFVTRGRAPMFRDHDLAMVAARAIEEPRLWTSSRLLAWVLMPDHWHGLLELGETVRLPAVVNALKTNTARQVRLAGPSMASVWARGYHDHALRTEESMIDVARYVVLNPVRAGLVLRVGDYPFWNAVWL